MKHQTLCLVTSLLVSALFLRACLPGVDSVPTAGSAEPSPTPSRVLATALSTTTPTLTTSPQPTQALTPTRTLEPTYPPRSTISPSNEAKIVAMQQDNGGCALPCVWGVMPGRSTWGQIEPLFQSMGAVTYSKTSSSGTLIYNRAFFRGPEAPPYNDPNYEDKTAALPSFSFGEDITDVDRIQTIFTRGSATYNQRFFERAWEPYSPQKILSQYGIPSRIFLSTVGGGPSGTRRMIGYSVYLIYDHLNFMMRYEGWSSRYSFVNGQYRFCPSIAKPYYEIDGIFIYTQSSDHPTPVDMLESSLRDMRSEKYKNLFHPFTQATGMSLEAYYRQVTQENNGCFYTPENIWYPHDPEREACEGEK